MEADCSRITSESAYNQRCTRRIVGRIISACQKAAPYGGAIGSGTAPDAADPTPWVLRWARKLALVAVIVGVLAAGTVAALRWLEDDGQQQAPVARDETAVSPSVASKPVPTAPEPRPQDTAAVPPANPRSSRPNRRHPRPSQLERSGQPNPSRRPPRRRAL